MTNFETPLYAFSADMTGNRSEMASLSKRNFAIQKFCTPLKPPHIKQIRDLLNPIQQMRFYSSVEEEKSGDDIAIPSCCPVESVVKRTAEPKKACPSLYTQEAKVSSAVETDQIPTWFGAEVRRHTEGTSDAPEFNKHLRNVMEPFVSQARINREQARMKLFPGVHGSIFSSIGIPYPTLRKERCFLFDIDMYPIHRVLADILGVADLSLLHEQENYGGIVWNEALMDCSSRQRFRDCYESFIIRFCIPFLHSLAITNDVRINSSQTTSSRVTYRYQAFPTVTVLKPGDSSTDYPHCDIAEGHSIGCLNFHVPLTPVYGTNALYTESSPGREDWHPLTSKSIGLGYLFDGARCLHFGLENTTEHTRVSIDFRMLVYHQGDRDDAQSGVVNHNDLCNKRVLEDRYSAAGGFYEEASIDTGNCHKERIGSFVATKSGNSKSIPSIFIGSPKSSPRSRK